MQCVYVNLHAPTYIKVIYPTARDIAQAAYRRALSKKGEPSQSYSSVVRMKVFGAHVVAWLTNRFLIL